MSNKNNHLLSNSEAFSFCLPVSLAVRLKIPFFSQQFHQDGRM